MDVERCNGEVYPDAIRISFTSDSGVSTSFCSPLGLLIANNLQAKKST